MFGRWGCGDGEDVSGKRQYGSDKNDVYWKFSDVYFYFLDRSSSCG
jgi:hypothetical protein